MRALLDSERIQREFPYPAIVSWPKIYSQETIDWITSITMVETWLETCVGHHLVRWVWLTNSDFNQCAVTFNYSQDQGLFLLRWA